MDSAWSMSSVETRQYAATRRIRSSCCAAVAAAIFRTPSPVSALTSCLRASFARARSVMNPLPGGRSAVPSCEAFAACTRCRARSSAFGRTSFKAASPLSFHFPTAILLAVWLYNHKDSSDATTVCRICPDYFSAWIMIQNPLTDSSHRHLSQAPHRR